MRLCRPLLLCLAFLAPACLAATGRIDLAFGTAGKALIDFAPLLPGTPSANYDNPHVLALQPDGKILVAGTAVETGTPSGGNRAAIARLNPDGTLDASFGSGGRTLIVFGSCGTGCQTTTSSPTSLAVLPDGKILLGGYFQTYASVPPYRDRANMAVARLHPNGALDAGFGTAGIASASMSPTSLDFGRMVLQPDGRILLVARTQEPLAGEPPWTTPRIALFRLDANGALDPSFGTGGKTSVAVAEGPNYPGGAQVLADGRIVVVAQVGPFEDMNVAVITLSNAGALQSAGVIDVGTQSRDFLDAGAFQPDGKIVFATSGGTEFPALVRVSTDGSRDPSFGSNGVVRLTQYDSVRGLHLLADGRILALTLSSQLWRFTANGQPDPTLGVAGMMPVEGSSGWISALQPDGRLLVASAISERPGSDMRVMRVEPDAPAPIEPSVASLPFAGQSMGMTSAPLAVVLTNTTGTALTIAAGSPIFPTTHDCGSQLAPGASCTLQVSFRPRVEGPHSSWVYVSTPAGTIGLPATGTGERSLVTHFYRSILRRAPDAGGKAFWTAEATRLSAAGVNPNEAWFAMSANFFSSAEYAAFARDDAGFVTDLYRTFFDRAPDSGGMAYWTGLLATSLPRSAILASFMLSPEFRMLAEATFGRPVVRAEMDMLMDFYRGILGRTPDESGLAYWTGQLRAAQCDRAASVAARADEISRLFLQSGEYAARGRGNPDFVADLYNAFLRRGPDAGGMAFWLGRLQEGSSREALRQQFVSSPEFGARVAAVVQQGCL